MPRVMSYADGEAIGKVGIYVAVGIAGHVAAPGATYGGLYRGQSRRHIYVQLILFVFYYAMHLK